MVLLGFNRFSVISYILNERVYGVLGMRARSHPGEVEIWGAGAAATITQLRFEFCSVWGCLLDVHGVCVCIICYRCNYTHCLTSHHLLIEVVARIDKRHGTQTPILTAHTHT